MLRNRKLWSAGMVVVMSLSGQGILLAGGHFGGMGGSGGHGGNSGGGHSMSMPSSIMGQHSMSHMNNNSVLSNHNNLGSQHNRVHSTSINHSSNHSQFLSNNSSKSNLLNSSGMNNNHVLNHSGMSSKSWGNSNLFSHNYGKNWCGKWGCGYGNWGYGGGYGGFGCGYYGSGYGYYGCGYGYGGYGYGYPGYSCGYSQYGCCNYSYLPGCFGSVSVAYVQPYCVTAYQTCSIPVVTPVVSLVQPTQVVETVSSVSVGTVPALSTVVENVTTAFIPPSPVTVAVK